MKNKMKIGLSILIALAFLLPSGAIMADTSVEKAISKADVNTNTQDTWYIGDGIFSQAGESVDANTIYFRGDSGLFELNPGDIIPYDDCYTILMKMIESGGGGNAIPHVEIYDLTEGIDVVMYETSFEDNFDIYNNWIQIDSDCGVTGGYYDSFSWTDKRSNCEDHSMKSTMYDIYKGNQDDYLECTKTFDVSDQYAINVSFDIWVEGQGSVEDEEYFDYLSFEIGDTSGTWITDLVTENDLPFWFVDTSQPVYLAYYDWTTNAVALGGGWWHVWYYATLPELEDLGLDPYNEEITFRFDWHSDPQFQYEGAYVDCFKVISVEDVRNKVFQTHSQNTVEFCDQIVFEFPLDWCCNLEEKCYELVWWIVGTAGDTSPHDEFNKVTIPFCVGDEIDCQITDIAVEDSFTEQLVEDGGIMEYGSDAHIMFEFYNGGNIPMEDIPVTLTVRKTFWEDVYTTSFESLPWPDTGGSPQLWHKTDFDSSDGSYALGMFDEDTKHYQNDMANYVLGPTLNMENVLEMYMDYDYKVVTESADSFMFIFKDPATNYLLGQGSPANPSGYHPEWVGPSNPMGYYQPFDIKAGYDNRVDAGTFFKDGTGKQTYDLSVGMYFISNANTYSNAQAESDGLYWSGLLFDNIHIRAKKLGEIVYTDTIIIPGPVEPGVTVDNLQFEWENVPYSNYQICVSVECTDDIDSDNNELCQEVLVVDNLEHATLKNVEYVDYTCQGSDIWGICGSDTDNYLSTNPDSETYATDTSSIVMLCPNNEGDCGVDSEACCIDISHLDIHDLPPVPHTFLSEDFSSGVPPTGWSQQDPGEWISYGGNIAGGTAPEADLYGPNIVGTSSYMDTPFFDASIADELTLEFRSMINWNNGIYDAHVYVFDGATWYDVTPWPTSITGDVAAAAYSIDLTPYIDSNMKIRFRLNNYNGANHQYWVIDDVVVHGLDHIPSAPDNLDFEFDAWWDLEDGFDYVFLEVSDGCPADTLLNWIEVKNYTGFSGDELTADDDDWVHEVIDLEPIITGTEFSLRFRFNSDDGTEQRGFLADDFHMDKIIDVTEITDPYPMYEDFDDPMDNMDNWCSDVLCYGNFWDGWCIDIPDLDIENALVWSTELGDAYEAYLLVNHTYTFQNKVPIWFDTFEQDPATSGLWTILDHDGGGNVFTYEFSTTWPPTVVEYVGLGWWEMLLTNTFDTSMISASMDLTGYANPVTIDVDQNYQNWYSDFKEIILWSGGAPELVIWDMQELYTSSIREVFSYTFDPSILSDPTDVQIEFHYYNDGYGSYTVDDLSGRYVIYSVDVYSATETAEGFLQISNDGGSNWATLDTFEGTTFGDDVEDGPYDISFWAGGDILIRFLVLGNEFSTDDRYWCINDLSIYGKKDTTAPTSSITMTGTMTDAGWYSSPVSCKITATDDTGVKEIHYILDGSEKVVAGKEASFTVSGNGAHNLEFWAVDLLGNVETPHNTVPTFRIDAGSPPSVAITAPEPGLYLFGNKLLSLSKVFIIGAFTAEATASDAESGVYRVQFLLDGDVIAEDTEAPFSAYVAAKHMGAGTLTVVAEDFSGNTAEDTLDITYYKFL